MQIIGIDIILGGGAGAKSALLFFKRLRFEKWEELIMDQKYETISVLHLGILTSRARMQKKVSPHVSCRHVNNNVRTRKKLKRVRVLA